MLLNKLRDKVRNQIEPEKVENAESLTGTDLKTLLDRADNKSQTARISKGYSHVSSLINMECVRQYVLCANHDIKIHEPVTGGHRIVWALGRAVESHIRQQYIAASGHKNLYGSWVCGCGKHSKETSDPVSLGNAPCGTPYRNYAELSLLCNDYRIQGSPDMVLCSDDNVLHVVEIKSIKDKVDDIKGPKPDHIVQAAMYQNLLARNPPSGYTVSNEVTVIYCSKVFVFGSPYKSFIIDTNDTGVQNTLNLLKQRAISIRNGIDGNIIPPRKVCSTPDSTKARSCPVCTICFGGC